MRITLRQKLLATTLLVGASALGAPAMAQDTDPAATTPTGPVEAQPTPDVSSQGEPVQTSGDIIVTGSRIPQPNLESASPVSVISDQDVKLTGTTRVEDVLGQLPSAAASQNSTLANGATGTAEVDLRYLGSKRTLTLVNGRRLTPGDPNSTTQAGDINIIPAALLKRAEVLTGGASSVYGADAVAGVVNFIIDTDFEGVRFDGTWSTFQHNNRNVDVIGGTVRDINNAKNFPFPTGSTFDGRAIDGTVSLGAGFDDGRGHVVAYFGYRKIKPILQSKRDYSSCVINGGGNNTCGGSATANPGTAILFASTTEGGYTSTIGALGPGSITIGAQNVFNYGPLNYFQRPDERYIAGAFANYEINEQIKPYLEFMFMDDHTLAQIAPSGDFGNTLTINCDNPLLSGAQFAAICGTSGNLINGFLGTFPLAAGAAYNTGLPGSGTPGPGAPPIDFIDPTTGNTYNRAFFQLLRRNTEGGPRISDLTHTTWRGVLGARGDLSNAFSYDAYYQYGRTNYSQVYRNEFSIARMNRALDVVTDPRVGSPTEGQPICRSNLDGTDPNCAPWDVFSNNISPAAINYLNIFGVITGRTTEQIAHVDFTGALGELGVTMPWAEDGVGINVGYEYRKESLHLDPDQSFQTGDLAGQGAPTLPVDGNFSVNELFGEIQVPIVQNSFIDELTFGAGYRKSWYKLSNGRKYDTDTYKLSLEFAPISDIRFRAAYNRAVRAPNIQELFAPQFVGLDGGTDPCAGIVITAADAGCIAQGLIVGQNTPLNPAEQYNGLLGGNQNLNPEKATTKTLGVVLQPRFIPRLAVTVDYWKIKLDGAIQGFGADTILADCVANTTDPNNPAPSCALINRDPAGSIWLTSLGYVVDTPTNVGGIKTDGIDIGASYAHRLGGLGNLSLSFLGTWLNHYITDNGIADPYDCVGFYGTVCSGGSVASLSPIPEWRHKMRATLQTPLGLGVSAQWRRVGKVQFEHNSDQEALTGNTNQLGNKVGAQNYFDLALTYSTFADRLNLRAGINNIFDKNPPLVSNSNGACPAGPCNGNTYPGYWDALGRYLYVGATLSFTPPKAPPPAPPVVAPPPPPPPPPPATQTCPDGSVILATEACPAPPPPPPPPPPAPERG